MKKIIIILNLLLFFSLYANAQSGRFTIPEYEVCIDENDEGSVEKLNDAHLSIGKIGATLSFGGFDAYVFIWTDEPPVYDKSIGLTKRKAIDLVSGEKFTLMIAKGNGTYDYVLQFVHRSGRRFSFPLIESK